MSILTDTDIQRLKDREIIIEPFETNNLSPIGYDLSVGDLIVSLTRGMLSLNPKTGSYHIHPKEIVLVLSKQFLWVSGRVAGTIHSKVSLVSKGFSHISTTLDPEWKGKLLLNLVNVSNDELTLKPNQLCATVVFYTTKSRATAKAGKPPARRDIILDLMHRTNPEVSQDEAEHSRKALIEKFKEILSDQEISTLEDKIRATHIGSRAASAAKEMLFSRGRYILMIFLHLFAIFVLVYIGWNLETWVPVLKQSIMVPVAFSASAAIIVNILRLSYE